MRKKELYAKLREIAELACAYSKRLNETFPKAPKRTELGKLHNAVEAIPWPTAAELAEQEVLPWLTTIRHLVERAIADKLTSPFEWLLAAGELEHAAMDSSYTGPNLAYRPPPDAFIMAMTNVPRTCNTKPYEEDEYRLLDDADFSSFLALAELVLVEAKRLALWAAAGPLDEISASMLLRVADRWLALESALVDEGLYSNCWMAWRDPLSDVARCLVDMARQVRKNNKWFRYLPCDDLSLPVLAPDATMGMHHDVFVRRLTVVVELLREVVADAGSVDPSATDEKAAALASATGRQNPPGAPNPEIAYSIQLTNEICYIRYQRECADYPVKGNRCLGWLTKLLARPNHGLTVANLCGDPDGKLAADAELRGEREIDEPGIIVIKTRLAEIESVEADTGGCESLENEKAKLLASLQKGTRGRRIHSALNRAHHNIASQIRAFLRDKLPMSMPHLAAHLTSALRLDFPHLGYFPPAGTPSWKS